MKRGCIALQWKRFQTIALVWNLFHWTPITRLWWFNSAWWETGTSWVTWFGGEAVGLPARGVGLQQPLGLPLLHEARPRTGSHRRCLYCGLSSLPGLGQAHTASTTNHPCCQGLQTHKNSQKSRSRVKSNESLLLCVFSVKCNRLLWPKYQLLQNPNWISHQVESLYHTGLLIIGCRHIYEGPPGQLIIVRWYLSKLLHKRISNKYGNLEIYPKNT